MNNNKLKKTKIFLNYTKKIAKFKINELTEHLFKMFIFVASNSFS
jgi:hypothetical protein